MRRMHGYARMASARDRMCRMRRMHQTVVYLAYIRVRPLIHGPAASRYLGLSAWAGWGMYPRVEPHIRRTSVNGPSPDIRRGAVWRISPDIRPPQDISPIRCHSLEKERIREEEVRRGEQRGENEGWRGHYTDSHDRDCSEPVSTTRVGCAEHSLRSMLQEPRLL